MGQRIDIVEDDAVLCASMSALLAAAGYATGTHASPKMLLENLDAETECIISDLYMPKMDGFELQAALAARNIRIPIIFVTGFANVPVAVRALKAGAADFLEKPFTSEKLLDSVRRAIIARRQIVLHDEKVQEAKNVLALLSPRELDVVRLLVAGHSNKFVANALGLSPRTVEHHRSNIMHKVSPRNFLDVLRIVIAAE
jgi:two-component system response regulator FixJ